MKTLIELFPSLKQLAIRNIHLQYPQVNRGINYWYRII